MSYADKANAYLELVEDLLQEIKESPRNRRLDEIHELCELVLEYKDGALDVIVQMMQPEIHRKRAAISALTLRMKPRSAYKTKQQMVDDMGMKYGIKTDCFILATL